LQFRNISDNSIIKSYSIVSDKVIYNNVNRTFFCFNARYLTTLKSNWVGVEDKLSTEDFEIIITNESITINQITEQIQYPYTETISDIQGKVIINNYFSQTGSVIKISNLSSAVYFLRINYNGKSLTQKFIKN